MDEDWSLGASSCKDPGFGRIPPVLHQRIQYIYYIMALDIFEQRRAANILLYINGLVFWTSQHIPVFIKNIPIKEYLIKISYLYIKLKIPIKQLHNTTVRIAKVDTQIPLINWRFSQKTFRTCFSFLFFSWVLGPS